MTYLITPPKGWQPPFCPNGKCKFHNRLPEKWRYKMFGSYVRKSDNRRIQRYRCMSCNRTFSTQTFSTTYWQKRPGLDAKIFTMTANGMCNRQIARELEVDPVTINRKIERLGRHCLLFLHQMMNQGPTAKEIVFDGFETFELNQFYPFHHNVAVEKGTDFILFFNDSELRRKGRMTPAQKIRRHQLEQKHGRPDPRAIEKGITELLSVVISGQGPTKVYTDDHAQYRKPIRYYGDAIVHSVTPGKQHRDKDNALWEINLFDRFFRHSNANHTRETLAWSKRRQSSTDRLAIFTVWRNYMNGRRQKDRRSPTPAMARGMLDRKMTVDNVLAQRIFFGHNELPESWRQYYRRDVVTRALPHNRRHELQYAE
jgi:hypothetical protein